MPTRRVKMLSLREARQAARIAVEAECPQLQVVGASPQHDSTIIELMFAVDDCEEEPCRLLLSVDRDAPVDVFEHSIRAALRRHVQSLKRSPRH